MGGLEMNKRLKMLAFVASLLIFLPVHAIALDQCTVGQKVIAPGDKLGTVIAVNGSACTVRQDDGVMGEQVWSAFMLKSPGGVDSNPLPAMTSIPAGTYKCYSTGGYTFTDIVIVSDDTYSDRNGAPGSYTIDAGGGITYISGPFVDHPSYAKNGNVYFTAPGGAFYMSCNPD